MSKAPPPDDWDDNPVWTDADIARAGPASEILPPHVVAALTRNGGGRPRAAAEEQVSLRVDHDVLERFRAGGRGWEARINDVLRKAVGL